MVTSIIEKYLTSIDPATFQKLMNHLLFLEGYKFVGSPGSVIGKNKTSKGSPDTFFEDKDKFVFCEFTTLERLNVGSSFFNKLKSDVEHCFNTKKTGIDKDRISKIILAFTEEITPAELDELKNIVKAHNTNSILITYSIQQIPFRLLYYPGLADKYIPGVKTTSASIFTLPDFLKTTERGLQPSLINPFAGREKEIEQAKKHLVEDDVLILTGGQGVGKTKLAVELAQYFESTADYQARVISSTPVPLWDDLPNVILPGKKYLILFDDANKSLPNLDYLLQFIHSREKGTVKLIITIRDYVHHELNNHLSDIHYNEITLKTFEHKELKEIISNTLPTDKSLDPIVMDKIITLSKGNSRLALMATSSILKDNNLSILKDVFSLYDKYFLNVKKEISFLENPEHLKALGVLSFFGVLDKKNEGVKDILEERFSIKWDDLWESFIELERVELVDVLYKETARISDQVLSTYVFYKNFIDPEYCPINYSEWILTFLEGYSGKIENTLIDVINTYGFDEVKDRITTLISKVQATLASDSVLLYKFYSIFWVYKQIDALVFISDWMESLDEESIPLHELKYSYEANDYVWAPEYVELLMSFWSHSTSLTKQSITLGLKLMLKQPSRIPEILKHLNERIGFQRFDSRYGYPRQFALLEVLLDESLSMRDKEIAEQLFLSIAPSFLEWEYNQVEGAGNGKMIIHNFSLVESSELVELRSVVTEKLIALYAFNAASVRSALEKYIWSARSLPGSIVLNELPIISKFIDEHLLSSNFSHCKFVFEYKSVLDELGIDILNKWDNFLSSQTMEVARIFNPSLFDDKADFDTREKELVKRIDSFFEGRDISFIEATFEKLDGMYKDGISGQDIYWLDESLSYTFQRFAELNTNLYFESLALLMLDKYSFEVTYGSIIANPIKRKLVDSKALYQHINRVEYKQKQFWKQTFFDVVGEDEIDDFLLKEYVYFVSSLQGRAYARLSECNRFDKQFQISKDTLPNSVTHTNVVTYFAEIILSRIDGVIIQFSPNVCSQCSIFFKDHVDLLKQLFYSNLRSNKNYNHSGKEIAAVSSQDHYFITDFLENMTNDRDFVLYKFRHLNLSFLWDFEDCEQILNRALDIIIIKAPIYSSTEHQANALFRNQNNTPERLERIYSFISNYISKHYLSKNHIHIILNVVTYSFNDQTLRFFKEFLLLNKDVEFIKCLWLEKSHIISGSRVPKIESNISFLKSLLEMVHSLPNIMDYVDHIKIWEQEIEWAKQEKQEQMRADFSGF